MQNTTKDLNLLHALAEFRLSTTPLLAARLGTSEQMIRRRCRKLADLGFLKCIPRNPGQGRGRPEWLYSLTGEGLRPLATAKLVPTNLSADQVTGDGIARMAEHQMLLNWFGVELDAISKMGGQFATQFISSTSPFHLSATGSTILRDKVEFPGGNEIFFTPDAAICIAHCALRKSLLFFTEIDMGTEVIADPKHVSNVDLRRKISIYRTYLGRRGYKRYESPELLNATFNGFRLLLIAATSKRCEALCRLVRATPPSAFVWVTDHAAIRQQGLGQSLWAVGGREGSRNSILGRCNPDMRGR